MRLLTLAAFLAFCLFCHGKLVRRVTHLLNDQEVDLAKAVLMSGYPQHNLDIVNSIATTRRPRRSPKNPKHKTGKVLNGIRVEKIQQHVPVMIQVTKDKICGGTLLDDRHILTAAHCFFHTGTICTRSFDIARWKQVVDNPNEMVIEFGGTCVGCGSGKEGNIPTTSYSSIVEKVIIPKRFVISRCRRSDIAVLRLNQPIDHKSTSELDIRIPYDPTLPSKATLEVSGFGYDPNEINQKTRYLNKLEVKIVPCARNVSEVFCTEEKESNVCKGDSGSGLVETVRPTYFERKGHVTVYGVVAHGTSCKLMQATLLQQRAGVHVESDFKGQYFTSTRFYAPFICKATENQVKIDGNATCNDLKKMKAEILQF